MNGRRWVTLPRAQRFWVVGALSLAISLCSSPAVAANLVVDRTDDSVTATACTAAPDDCSLRGAILTANALATSAVPEASDIAVPVGTYPLSQASSCTYRLNSEAFPRTSSQIPLCINAEVTIHGDGAGSTTIDAGQVAGAMFVSAEAEVEIRSLTVENGNVLEGRFATFPPRGGGIHNEGTLTLTDAEVRGCRTNKLGGGIYNAHSLTLLRSSLVFNSAVGDIVVFGTGGAIYGDAQSSTTIIDSEVADNTAEHTAGGIFVFQGDLDIRGSAIVRNIAQFSTGGGIHLDSASTATIENSTLARNESRVAGGAIYVFPGAAQVQLANVTIVGNSAGIPTHPGASGGGIYKGFSGSVTLKNSLIAGNTLQGTSSFGPDCFTQSGGLTSQGYNLVQSTASCTISGDTTGNVTGVDAVVAPLADNGGPGETIALLTGSPAIDAANPAGCTDVAGSPLLTDQRGSPRSVDGNGDGTPRCDIGAFELGGGSTGGPTISRVQPGEGGAAGELLVIVRGTGFQDGAIIKLERAGEADVVGTDTTIGGSGQLAFTSLDLSNRTLGAWDVVVENPDDSTGSASGAFTIAAPRAPEIWVDFVGPSSIRLGRPTRYLVLYGNRGNQDAYAVPLMVGVEENQLVEPRFEIAPPPQQFGKITIQEFGFFRDSIISGEGPPLRQLPLLLPVVPAGSSGALEVLITSPVGPVGVNDPPVPVMVERGASLFEDGPTPEAIATLMAGARDKSERLFKYTIPTAIDPDLEEYIATQLETIVAEGRAALLASFGTETKVYSLSQLSYDLAAFGLVWAQNHPPLLAARGPSGAELLRGLFARAVAGVGDFCAATAQAQGLACVCGQGPRGLTCCAGCSCPPDDGKDVPDIKRCALEDIAKKKPGCGAPEDPSECRQMGFFVLRGRDAAGNDVSVCTQNPRCIVTNPGLADCRIFPLRRVSSRDPNDKSGPLGAGDEHFIRDDLPIKYTIRFENQPEATAPAADVVITDVLDPSRMDLASLSLGPIGFGAQAQVVPPPGTTDFTQDVDLRPANDLIVRIEASLDAATSVLTWRFTSLDPDTLEPTEDPLAGFLPPNQTPPEGDGFVSFTVDPVPGLATGTEIANQAEIVFDVNEPIVTPLWSNTIDVSPPTSQIDAVAPSGTCSQDLAVSWSGSDAGAGIGDFTILVSEDDGPFVEWLASDQAAGTFPGKWGRSYSFRSIAADRAGNIQTAPSEASASVLVADCGPFDLAVTKITAPKVVKLDAKRPARTIAVKVQIQNRSAEAQTIADAATLTSVVTLVADPLAVGCAPARVELHEGKPQKALPLTLGAKKKATIFFDVLLDCAGDPTKGVGHEDFALSAAVHQSALGGVDAHPEDDPCPRPGSKPPVKDPFPDGRVVEAGCGSKQASGALGAPALVDVVVD